MTALTTVPEEAHALRTLVDRASSALADARTAAEVLDARDMAAIAYDTAKRTARLLRTKRAHDDLIAAAQARGEVQRHGGGVADHNIPSTADLGLRRAAQCLDAILAANSKPAARTEVLS